MTSITKRVLQIAAGELGTTEQPAHSNRTKYGAWIGLDGQPWCMSFVQWCFDQAGTPLPFKTGSCSALLNWYRKNQPECVVSDPQPGDIVLYSFGHTGILEKTGDLLTVIEGNTSADSSGSQTNGGGVFRRTRSKTLVTAYLRPHAEEKGEELPLPVQKLYNTVAECPEWARETVRKLVQLGALNGETGRTDAGGLPAGLRLNDDLLRVFVVLDRAGSIPTPDQRNTTQ